MRRKVSLYLRDILNNMRLCREFAAGMTLEAFRADPKTAYAVLRCPEVMREAAKNVPEEIRAQYPHVPWKDMPAVAPLIEQALRDHQDD